MLIKLGWDNIIYAVEEQNTWHAICWLEFQEISWYCKLNLDMQYCKFFHTGDRFDYMQWKYRRKPTMIFCILYLLIVVAWGYRTLYDYKK